MKLLVLFILKRGVIMTVHLYNNSADNTILDKSAHLTTVRANVNADVKGSCSIEHPVLILDYAGVNFNYVYIPAFGRYYYVTEIIVNTADRVMIACQSDVLYSFIDSIKALNVLVSRNENEYNNRLVDNMLPINALREYHVKVFDNTAVVKSTEHFILGVI